MNRVLRVIIVAAGFAAGGCVTSQPPKQAHIEASSAIRAAEELVRADRPMPDAQHYLASAREQVRAGEKLLEGNNYRGAELHFQRAEVDAETALALARAHEAEIDAKKAEARLEGLTNDATEVPEDVD